MATPSTNDNNQQPQLPNTQHAALIREFGEPEVMIYQDGVDIPEKSPGTHRLSSDLVSGSHPMGQLLPGFQ